jgi:hypothetical protein
MAAIIPEHSVVLYYDNYLNGLPTQSPKEPRQIIPLPNSAIRPALPNHLLRSLVAITCFALT